MEVVPGAALGLVRAFVHSLGAAGPWEALRIRFRLRALGLTPNFPQENGPLTEQVIWFLNYSEKVSLFLC